MGLANEKGRNRRESKERVKENFMAKRYDGMLHLVWYKCSLRGASSVMVMQQLMVSMVKSVYRAHQSPTEYRESEIPNTEDIPKWTSTWMKYSLIVVLPHNIRY